MSATINVPEELLYEYLPNTELCIAAVSNKAYLHKDILVPLLPVSIYLYYYLTLVQTHTPPSERNQPKV